MRRGVFIFLFFLLYFNSFSQDYGGDKVGIGNFVRRMYQSQPFSGIKLLQTQDGHDYMVSVVEVNKDPSRSESIQSRIASVKAKAYASQYLNGSNISSEVIVVTTENKRKDSVYNSTTIQEILKESSIGFVEGMELLSKFESPDTLHLVYIYYRILKI